jgi:hypothetical protein
MKLFLATVDLEAASHGEELGNTCAPLIPKGNIDGPLERKRAFSAAPCWLANDREGTSCHYSRSRCPIVVLSNHGFQPLVPSLDGRGIGEEPRQGYSPLLQNCKDGGGVWSTSILPINHNGINTDIRDNLYLSAPERREPGILVTRYTATPCLCLPSASGGERRRLDTGQGISPKVVILLRWCGLRVLPRQIGLGFGMQLWRRRETSSWGRR